jgi:hypothetical protein
MFVASNVPWLNIELGLIERVIASMFHITMCYIVVYANFETEPTMKYRPSLWLAIIFHMLFDGIIIIWLQFGGIIFGDDALSYAISIELAFLIITVGLICFTWLFWIPRKEKMILVNNNVQDQKKLPPKRDDIKLDSVL